MRTIELLAPAKNVECGKAAIDHGADAVYIGAQKFGARQSAGNSVEDIAELCAYAHRYDARVHVTLNTIIYDHELDDTIKLVEELIEVGVDAFLVQDMGLFSAIKKLLPPYVALHASTQCDTRTVNKAKWLQQQGFNRVVLARELSADEIKNIHEQLPSLELEAFVHGALCVSYSGVCYASQHCFDRSANRGACSQFCRLAFDLVDSDGHMIEKQAHLLSLKDMKQIDNLETLMRSGACSFKIEGRLKDINYVKNVVSAYSQRLAPNTPKALGEYVGKVKELRKDSFNVAGTATFTNGDGLCFLRMTVVDGIEKTTLEGFRVNRAEGNRLYPYKMPQGLKPGVGLYRNQDQAFEKELSGETAVRRISVAMCLEKYKEGYVLKAEILSSHNAFPQVEVKLPFEHQLAKKAQCENIVKQLTKLGTTVYECHNMAIGEGVEQCFIPNSVLAELRRMIVEQLDKMVAAQRMQERYRHMAVGKNRLVVIEANPKQYQGFTYLYNISNQVALQFYQAQGLKEVDMAYEIANKYKIDRVKNQRESVPDALLMQCRHCIRYSLGYCVKRGGKQPSWHEPLYLTLPDKRKFRLEFDCKNCQMNIHPAE